MATKKSKNDISDLISDDISDLSTPDAIQPGPVGRYLKQAGEFYTKDIPEAAKSWYESSIKSMTAPTITSQIATNPEAQKQGTAAEIITGVPERTVRGLGAMAGGVGTLGGLALSSLNRGLGGIPSRMAESYLQSPVSQGLQRAGGALARTPEGQGLYKTFQNPAVAATGGAIGNIAALYGGPKGAGGVLKTGELAQKATMGAGEALIRPKVKQYIQAGKDVAAEAFGETTKEQVKAASKIIADEGLHNTIGDPEKLMVAATEKANKYTGAAYAQSVKKASYYAEGPLNLAGNPIETARKSILKQLENGKLHGKTIPAGDMKVYKNQLEKTLADMSERGYDKNLPEHMAISFKRDLGVKWTKGSAIEPLEETAKNTVRKAAYYAVDDLIKDQTTRNLMSKASKLYKVSEVVSGQQKTWTPTIAGILGLGGTAEVARVIPHAAAPAAVIGGLGLGYGAYKSGMAGRGLLTLGNIGKIKQKIPYQASPGMQEIFRKENLKRRP